MLRIDSPADARFAVVQSDHAGGARRATELLISHGRADIRHLAGPAGSFAAAAVNTPRGRRAPGAIRNPSSSSSSRLRVSAGDSPASGLPPGCMNAVVPSLRTSRSLRRLSRMTAADTRMRRGESGVTLAP